MSYPRPGSGAANERSYPTSNKQKVRRGRRAERSYSTFKLRKGDFVQSKEQQLLFAGAAMKRYPCPRLEKSK